MVAYAFKQHVCMTGINERISRRLRERRNRLGWSATKVATLAGISQPQVSRIESGHSAVSEETLIKLAGAVGMSVDALIAPEGNVVDAVADFRTVPVLDYVQAGRWRSVNPLEGIETSDYVTTNLECPPSTFALRIKGDSMLPAFREGDVVLIAPTVPPRPGDFVVATDEDGDATFKQYREIGLNADGVRVFELVPLNPNFARMRSDVQPIAVVGVMIEHRTYRQR